MRVAGGSIGWLARFWLAVCAGLAVVIVYQLSKSFPLAPTVTAAPLSVSLPDPAERSTPPRPPAANAVEQIAARPLFSESRRPYVPPAAPVEEAAAEPGQPGSLLELAGIYLSGTDQAALLLVSGGTPEWLRKGQLIEGWEIEAIERDRVRLRKGERQQVLRLREDIAVLKTAWPVAERETRGDDATAGGLDEEPTDGDASAQE
jgi:hypothetical protein